MMLTDLWARVKGRCARGAAESLFRRPRALRLPAPVVSCTFDDFPQSAYRVAGPILQRHGGRGTYYTALGLVGQETCVGRIFSLADLRGVVADGHELGCHTYAHCNSGTTPPRVFEASIVENGRRLQELLPGASFRTLSFPIAHPRPHTKRRAAGHFPACRGGGQTFNAGTVDLNLLRSFFLERSGPGTEPARAAIRACCAARGWLIFATHDVCANPTSYGCTPAFFEEVVRCAVDSGARILPVGRVLEEFLPSARPPSASPGRS